MKILMFTRTVSIDTYGHTVSVCLDSPFPENLHDFSQIAVKDTLPKRYELEQIMKIFVIKYIVLHCIVT
jgi:hypothetical protein